MSDYTKTTNFTAKDALPTGNPAKIAKGTEVDTEFDNIATAIATKANKISGGTSGDIVLQDANGDMSDAGLDLSQFLRSDTADQMDAVLTLAAAPILNNNIALNAKESGGTSRSVAKMAADNDLLLGDSAVDLELYGLTFALNDGTDVASISLSASALTLTDPGAGTFVFGSGYITDGTKRIAGPHRGAAAYLTSSLTLTTATWNRITFATGGASELYDTDSIHNMSTNTGRFTVPSGVTKVRLRGALGTFGVNTGSEVLVSVYKNGTALTAPRVGFNAEVSSTTEGEQTFCSPVLTVTSGDYFELFAYVVSSGTPYATASYTWFEMEIVE